MMLLRKIRIENIGPFSSETPLSFEDRVTVLTGQNDVGKSLLLSLIERITKRDASGAITEQEVALDHRIPPTAEWENDPRLKVVARFCADPSQGGKEVEIEYLLAPKCWRIVGHGELVLHGQLCRGQIGLESFAGWPKAVVIPANPDESISSEIDLTEMSGAERSLLRVAFGKDIHPNEFAKLPILARRTAVRTAEQRLNARLDGFLPPTLGYRFVIEPPVEQRPVVHLGLLDAHNGLTSFGQRGAGVRKLIDLLGRFAVENIGSQPTILILDEPENSLHADAQHALRYALEQLATLENVQVIYATHSPAMINPMRPETLRLLQRTRRSERAWTIVDNRPIKEDFAAVRCALGISPTDSLLYAPVVVLVEGRTETLCLPTLMRRLFEAGRSEFSDVPDLLGNCLFLAVGGDHFSSQCKLAKTFGVSPIVFADGDALKRVKHQLQKEHNDVELITLPDPNHELENIIPPQVYFQALADFMQLSGEEISEPAFKKWEAHAKLNPRMMFSKRIERWITDTFDPNFCRKSEILFAACSRVSTEEVNCESLIKLLDAIRKTIAKTISPFNGQDLDV